MKQNSEIVVLCVQQVLANQGLVQPVGVAQGQEIGAGHYSDTTASATGSDDEGSTAATDGSTLRTSPAEQVLYHIYIHHSISMIIYHIYNLMHFIIVKH